MAGSNQHLAYRNITLRALFLFCYCEMGRSLSNDHFRAQKSAISGETFTGAFRVLPPSKKTTKYWSDYGLQNTRLCGNMSACLEDYVIPDYQIWWIRVISHIFQQTRSFCQDLTLTALSPVSGRKYCCLADLSSLFWDLYVAFNFH